MKRVSQNNPLAALIGLEKRVREVDNIDELHFLIVNETHNLISYRQAVLFTEDGALLSISGVSNFESGAPFVHWVKDNISPIISDFVNPKQLNGNDFVTHNTIEWAEWFPEKAYVLPLISPTRGHVGRLLLVRDYNWNDNEQEILSILAGAYGHALGFFIKPKRSRSILSKKNIVRFTVSCLFLGLFFIKVPLTVLAPAEIVAVNPSVIRAPTNGVVKRVFVTPNQIVNVGDALFEMDAVSQKNELEIAEKVFASLKAQYSQLTRIALSNASSKRYLAETVGRIREQKAKIRYLKELIQRMRMTSLVRGSVIIDDPLSWAGRPVHLGEKVLSLADQTNVEIEAWLPIADAIDLPKGSQIRLYLNSDPLSPIEGVLHTFSYEAQKRLGETYSHRIRAKISNEDTVPRLGLRGTARIEGEKVILLYWIFRRPLSTIRQFVGI